MGKRDKTMSFLKRIQRTVDEIAQVGFDRMGIRYSPIHVDDEDDPDVRQRDVLDIYRDVVSTWKGGAASPVPLKMRPALRIMAKRYCHRNVEAEAAVESWIEDRRLINTPNVHAPQQDNATLETTDAQIIESECRRVLAFYGVLQSPKWPWLSSAYEVCKAQKRAAKNLLNQANRQIERRLHEENADTSTNDAESLSHTLTLEDWVSAMNERLSAFDIALEIVDDWITIADIKSD